MERAYNLIIRNTTRSFNIVAGWQHVKKEHGQVALTVARMLEDLKIRVMKTEADIHFIKTCKREKIIQTFAKVKLSIKHGNKNFIQKLPDLLSKQNCKPNIKLKRKSKEK